MHVDSSDRIQSTNEKRVSPFWLFLCLTSIIRSLTEMWTNENRLRRKGTKFPCCKSSCSISIPWLPVFLSSPCPFHSFFFSSKEKQRSLIPFIPITFCFFTFYRNNHSHLNWFALSSTGAPYWSLILIGFFELSVHVTLLFVRNVQRDNDRESSSSLSSVF